MSNLTSVHHLALTVTDVDRSVPWYERVLDLKEIARREDAGSGIRKVHLRAPGDAFTVVLVQHPDTERGDFDERRTGLDHVAFKVDSFAELKEWEQRLAGYSVTYTPVTASRTLPGASVVVFRDPDGIQLEVWTERES
ncbi:MAG TPA: VOC family protein [Amycolatopsis sp.]|uniref:VOC family protein n=1 Tax=Amycolatopsis sp. TaxID=37632 RepID=UPI002B458D13|nr:VOC family protein [Amycolatopsis sp.]HKS45598.1 VOC family protein [Amycolatopsis sp.]